MSNPTGDALAAFAAQHGISTDAERELKERLLAKFRYDRVGRIAIVLLIPR